MEKLLAMPSKILILGGTAEAREIAALLIAGGHDVTSSLAGVTTEPVLPKGRTRIGGFGGVAGLRDYLNSENVEVVVDATHPFAALMSANAAAAIINTPTRLLRFERPAWLPSAGDNWHSVDNIQLAADFLPYNARAFVTTGRKELQPFFQRDDIGGVVRTVELPNNDVPIAWRVILERPPHTLEIELGPFENEKLTPLISNNKSGR